jgi:ribosomal protein S18 acetylase RimI-like enzyme
MAAPPSFEPLRTAAFKSILMRAFKSFPARVEEILKRHRWTSFIDFMVEVEDHGRVLLAYQKPLMKTIQERGIEAAIAESLGNANTESMLDLLAVSFLGEPDMEAVRAALEELEIRSWGDLAHAVFEIALQLFGTRTRGMSPLEFAKTPTLLFYRMRVHSPPHAVMQVAEAFSLATPRHFEALRAAFNAAEITIEDLDRAIGKPEEMTAVVNRSPSNPEKGIVFAPPALGAPPSMGSSDIPEENVRVDWSGLPYETGEIEILTPDGRVKAVFGLPQALGNYLLGDRWEDLADRVRDFRGLAAYIVSVAVVPEKRGRGTGTELVRETLGRLQALGVRNVVLHAVPTEPGRMPDLIRLYERLGFVEDLTVRSLYPVMWLDLG